MKKEPEKNPYNIYYDNYLDTNACTECTGLIPFIEKREGDGKARWDRYRDVFDFFPEEIGEDEKYQ